MKNQIKKLIAEIEDFANGARSLKEVAATLKKIVAGEEAQEICGHCGEDMTATGGIYTRVDGSCPHCGEEAY